MRDLSRPHLISQVLESSIVANSSNGHFLSVQPFLTFLNETRKNERESGVKSMPRLIETSTYFKPFQKSIWLKVVRLFKENPRSSQPFNYLIIPT